VGAEKIAVVKKKKSSKLVAHGESKIRVVCEVYVYKRRGEGFEKG